MPATASSDDIRSAFARAMSDMYRAEVPLYGDLVEIVETVNARVLRDDPALRAKLDRGGEIAGLNDERHGAIRVGTADELTVLRRAFAVMGMHPVGYYDLAPAGVPVHSTAFRPFDPAALARNSFRIFTSLLRVDLVEPPELRARLAEILARRQIVSSDAIRLIERWEQEGSLTVEEAGRFVVAILDTFRWHGTATVDAETYRRLHEAHRLVVDIASFPGPHINHLTPRVLDIDAAQAEMQRRGMDVKASIEGPPRRAVPILLRQTSFKALDEPVVFDDAASGLASTHTARFGEIEQRGVALTREGRGLYDRLLDEGRARPGAPDEALVAAFEHFPDDEEALRRRGLAFFAYRMADDAVLPKGTSVELGELIAEGSVVAEPILYQDFLPVSAAGIFQSNLGAEQRGSFAQADRQDSFEAALGCPVHDPFLLYEAIQQESLAAIGLGGVPRPISS